MCTGSLGLPSPWPEAGSTRCGRDLVQGGETGLVDRPEGRVVRRQRRVLVDEEELAAVGAGSGVGHRERAARVDHRVLQIGAVRLVLIGRVLVRELVARAAGAVALRVATLQHGQALTRRQPVAAGVVEVPLLGEAGEAVHRARCLGVVQLEADVALVGAHADADLSGIRWHVARAGRGRLLRSRIGRRRVLAVLPEPGWRRKSRQRLGRSGLPGRSVGRRRSVGLVAADAVLVAESLL